MLTPDQIRRRAVRRYDAVLRGVCAGDALFPMAIFGSGLRVTQGFAADRAAIADLRHHSKEVTGHGYDIVWHDRTFRRLGPQTVPQQVVFATLEDYVRFIGKSAEMRQFQRDFAFIRERAPECNSLGDFVR